MSIFRVEKSKNYTVMSNVHLRDPKLSLKAKGLLSQILSFPDDWNFTLRGLSTNNKESINTISNVVNELIEAGYIVREQCRSDTGHFGEASYVIYEVPPKMLEEMPEKPVLKMAQAKVTEPCHKNCDTVKEENVEKSAYLQGKLDVTSDAPCHKNCDTVNKSIVSPCHKKPYTVNCDSNQILNKQNTNNISYPSFHSRNIPRDISRDHSDDIVPTVGTMEGSETTLTPLGYEQYLNIIKSNIAYEDLVLVAPESREMIDGIVDIMLDVLLSRKKSYRISGEQKPLNLVRAKFMKLDMMDIQYLLDCLANNTTKIRDTKAYVISCLYNARETRGVYFQNAVNHDLYGRKNNDDGGGG